MSLLDIAKKRYSVRKYEDKPAVRQRLSAKDRNRPQQYEYLQLSGSTGDHRRPLASHTGVATEGLPGYRRRS